MAEEEKKKRVVTAPSTPSGATSGEVISVEVSEDEEVEWVWSHDAASGSAVTGYRIVPKVEA
jgi:hypothetical protein